ncbi:MAG: CoA transferase [Dehalococcoidales bacterium]|nr:CoA transferase [Dehalococcoidales bacterium]
MENMEVSVKYNPALDGLRVIDLGRVWSGPLTTRILADFGAEVIKVESLAGRGAYAGPAARQNSLTEDFPDRQPGEHPWNRIGMFNDLNRNKQSLTLDLSKDEGKKMFRQLVAISDVVVENYTPRVMANFGLDYPALQQINSRLIMLSMPAFGMTGPYREFPGYGNTIEPVAGLTNLTGYRGGPPEPLGMIAGDVLAALHGVSAVMSALWQRQRTGRGQYLDLSQAETQTSVIGEFILGYQMTGKKPERWGNRHTSKAPHGCYRCQGEDNWVAISIGTDDAWQRLCVAMDKPELVKDTRFADQLSRWQNQDELDELIGACTEQHDHIELAARLQSAGVMCGAVLNGKELLRDTHLKARGFMVDITQRDSGLHPYAGVPIKFSKSPAEILTGAPGLGEHNHNVLSGLLGISDDMISQLEKKGVIGERPPDASVK